MFFHGCYTIRFMVCNETLLAFGVHVQYLRWSCITMTNNTLHDLILRKVHGLVIIHLLKWPSKWIMVVWLLSHFLSTQVFHMHFNNNLFINNNLLLILFSFTTRNLVICNQSLCNWHATNCRLQLSWSYLQLQIWYCIIFRPYGCVCN